MTRERQRANRDKNACGAGAARLPRTASATVRPDSVQTATLVADALKTRAALLADSETDAIRVVNGRADQLDGLIIEKFADVLVAQLHEDRLRMSEAEARDVCASARRILGARAVYRKWFPRSRSAANRELQALHTSKEPWLGVAVEPEITIRENGVRFLARPYDGYSVGIFLEQRHNRREVARLAAGGAVLNTFSYTCGFSVAAAAGGATTTVSVDVSRKYLEWGRQNFAANGLTLDNQIFINSDVFDYYRRARRQGKKFDLIILDPPTFGRAKRPRRAFSITADLQRLVDGAAEILNPGGHILLATNCRGVTHSDLERSLATALGSGHRIVSRPELPADFAGDPGYASAIIAHAG